MAAPRQGQNGPGPQNGRGGQGTKDGGRKKGVYTINVTLPSLISAGIVAIIGFGWVFVLGVIVGRGYNPEERLGIDRIMPKPAANASAGASPTPMPGGVIKPEELQFMDSLRAKPAPVSGNAGVSVNASEIVAKNGKKDQKPDTKPDTKTDTKADAKKDTKTAKADTKTDSRAAQKTEAKPDTKADTKKDAQKDTRKTATSTAAPKDARESKDSKDTKDTKATEAKPADGDRFDYVYQVAAYKAADPANALKAKLEASGIKVRMDSSVENGVSWYRLNALFRGTPEDTRQLRAALSKHGIDKVILRSKTPVSR
ncbi:SPOR domain-containing protein [Nitratidesulfovibrio sp. SRB-5]|uniref:SPOR domain-containing protein n=1 Tax=Nitratidesulfovibrio sp. SRB-5 TaxID=2872636 RepID=UPI0010263296|nr:SPOR domain-containing protein [Nitratidesulfovibrio sp. SRB-5]MBZ2172833.1 SPOR domain-containing protein [Nitratidesulfovibrio sp. SRB-5]RXF76899.1 SPOR domain-containing protein [Desulfovibrio sp. DS-1]